MFLIIFIYCPACFNFCSSLIYNMYDFLTLDSRGWGDEFVPLPTENVYCIYNVQSMFLKFSDFRLFWYRNMYGKENFWSYKKYFMFYFKNRKLPQKCWLKRKTCRQHSIRTQILEHLKYLCRLERTYFFAYFQFFDLKIVYNSLFSWMIVKMDLVGFASKL